MFRTGTNFILVYNNRRNDNHSSINFAYLRFQMQESNYNETVCDLNSLAMSKLLRLILLCLIITNACLPRFCICLASTKNEQIVESFHSFERAEACEDCGLPDFCCNLIHKSSSNSDVSLISNFQTCLAIVILIMTSNSSEQPIDNSPTAIFKNFVSLYSKWPCTKFYLAKQSLLI